MAPELALHWSVTDVPITGAMLAGDVFPKAPGGVGPPPPFASATAAAALAIPEPHVAVLQLLPAGKGVAVERSMVVTWAGVSEGLTESISETIPTTCGVAMLVPW